MPCRESPSWRQMHRQVQALRWVHARLALVQIAAFRDHPAHCVLPVKVMSLCCHLSVQLRGAERTVKWSLYVTLPVILDTAGWAEIACTSYGWSSSISGGCQTVGRKGERPAAVTGRNQYKAYKL
jgi:hypothetical protein